MGNVVNLNRFRKRKAKEEKEKRAETNRRLHGRTKAERLADLKQKLLLERKLDGARLSAAPPADGAERSRDTVAPTQADGHVAEPEASAPSDD